MSPPQTPKATPIRLAVVLPVFNDWASVARVVTALRAELVSRALVSRAEILIIDDGSTETASILEQREIADSGARVEMLPSNVGHQRALLAGIQIASEEAPDYIIAMDADGEDEPEFVGELVTSALLNASKTVVAKRGLRSESLPFRIAYRGHKLLFRLLVGERLDFGNFLILPLSDAVRIARMPEASSHLAAAVLKSRVGLLRVTADRGVRLQGSSKMNFESLISHSFSSLSVFTERIMVRLVVFSFLATLASTIATLVVVGIRLFSDAATPGWATAASGLLIVLSFQFLSFAGLGTLITLNVATLRDFFKHENR